MHVQGTRGLQRGWVRSHRRVPDVPAQAELSQHHFGWKDAGKGGKKNIGLGTFPSLASLGSCVLTYVRACVMRACE